MKPATRIDRVPSTVCHVKHLPGHPVARPSATGAPPDGGLMLSSAPGLWKASPLRPSGYRRPPADPRGEASTAPELPTWATVTGDPQTARTTAPAGAGRG